MNISNNYVRNLYRASLVFLIILSLFFVVKLMTEWRSFTMMGSSAANTISLNGTGEVAAEPDIAEIYFTIRKDAKTVKEAQEAVALVEKVVLDFLRESQIEDRDIKTTSSSFNPKYEYRYDSVSLIPCNEFGCPPRPGRNVLVGYEAIESLVVRVRNTDEVGKILEGLGSRGVSELNGPNFTIDDEHALQAEARRLAILDAQNKARILAKDLGVTLIRVSSFSESGSYPIFYSKAEMAFERDGALPVRAEIPKGENIVTSNVTITYEIR